MRMLSGWQAEPGSEHSRPMERTHFLSVYSPGLTVMQPGPTQNAPEPTHRAMRLPPCTTPLPAAWHPSSVAV